MPSRASLMGGRSRPRSNWCERRIIGRAPASTEADERFVYSDESRVRALLGTAAEARRAFPQLSQSPPPRAEPNLFGVAVPPRTAVRRRGRRESPRVGIQLPWGSGPPFRSPQRRTSPEPLGSQPRPARDAYIVGGLAQPSSDRPECP